MSSGTFCGFLLAECCVPAKLYAGKEKSKMLNLSWNLSCTDAVFLSLRPLRREKMGPPENRLGPPPPPPPPCLAGFFYFLIWTESTASWISLPHSLCPSTPPCFVRGPNTQVWTTMHREIKNKPPDLIRLGFMWRYVLEQRRPPVQSRGTLEPRYKCTWHL